MIKNPPANARDMRHRVDSWVRKIPWRRGWQPTPVLLSGESHGQRSLAGYSPGGRKESDTTESLSHKCDGDRLSAPWGGFSLLGFDVKASRLLSF